MNIHQEKQVDICLNVAVLMTCISHDTIGYKVEKNGIRLKNRTAEKIYRIIFYNFKFRSKSIRLSG